MTNGYIGFVPARTTAYELSGAELAVAERIENGAFLLPVDHEGFPVTYTGDDTDERMYRHLADEIAHGARQFDNEDELKKFMKECGFIVTA